MSQDETANAVVEEAADIIFSRGSQLRSQVLGADHVARNGGTVRTEATDLQRLATEIGWGTVWQRPTLNLRERSLMTVAMLIALNRPRELVLHTRGALANGVTEEELREIVVHAIPYCGFPAAIDGQHVIDGVLDAR